MNKQIIATVILTLSLTCLANSGELKGIDFVRSVEKFDFIINSGEKADGLISKIIEIAGRLAVLHLDWEFRFSGEFDCAIGRIEDHSKPYALPMNLVTNHLLLSVITGPPARYPFNSVSCQMVGGEGFTILIRGFFTGSKVDIPTANDIELRPLGLYGQIPISILEKE